MTEHRPPTILGPYGEGYCKHCRFVEGLDENGLINRHDRAIGASGQSQQCEGSGTKPPGLTPYSSRSAVFRSAARKETCPQCCQQVAVLADSTRRYLAGHTQPHSVVYCPGGYQTWTPPDRGERR